MSNPDAMHPCPQCNQLQWAEGFAHVTDSQKQNPQPFCRECLTEHVRLYDCGGLFPFWIDGEPVEAWIKQHHPSWR